MVAPASRAASWKRELLAVLMGLVAAAGTFAAITASLTLPHGQLPSGLQLLWTSIASFTTGVPSFLQARHSLQARSPSGPADSEPELSALFQLPRDISDFTGRADLVERLAGLLTPGSVAVPVVDISGQGGVGKTALAVHVAHRLRSSYPDAQLYVNLRGVEVVRLDPAAVLAEFLGYLGIPGSALPPSLEERMRLYRARLTGRRALIVLDNAASEAQVRPLLPGSSGCAVLITSRVRLSALEGVHTVDLTVLRTDEAVDLFARVAGTDRVRAEPTAVRELVQLCGHLPLAVRIAAARLEDRRHWRLAHYVERLRDERRRLSELQARDDQVRAAFAVGYELRGPSERRLFRLLGLIRSADFASWTAAALLDSAPAEAEDLADSLVEAQLLEAFGGSEGVPRYRFHDLLRLYARERLEQEEADRVRRAATVVLLDAYLAYGRRANARIERWPVDPYDPVTDPEPVWWDSAVAALIAVAPTRWLSRERSGLVAAVRQAHAAQLWEHAWNLASTLPTVLEWEANWTDWKAVLDISLDAADQAGDRRRRAIALHRLARFFWDRDDWTQAARYFDECFAVLEGLHDERLTAIAERGRGELYRDQGQWDQAVACYERGLAYFRASGERHWSARIVGNLGDVYRDQGRWTQATECYNECLPVFRELEDERSVAITLRSLGDVYRDQGLLTQAMSCYNECLPTLRVLGDVRWQAFTLRARAVAQGLQQNWTAALADAQEAITIFRDVNDRRGEAIVLRILGDVHADRGEWTEAIARYQESLPILAELGDHRTGAINRRSLGRAHHRMGDRPSAAAEYERSLAVFRQLADRRGEALVLQDLAEVRRDQGDLAEALNLYDRCLAIVRQLGEADWAERIIEARGGERDPAS